MGRTSPAYRVDANHGEIVAAFRKAGCSVVSLAMVGSGCPDLLIGWRDRTILVEIKTETGELRESQKKWNASWVGDRPCLVRSLEDVEKVIAYYR